MSENGNKEEEEKGKMVEMTRRRYKAFIKIDISCIHIL